MSNYGNLHITWSDHHNGYRYRKLSQCKLTFIRVRKGDYSLLIMTYMFKKLLTNQQLLTKLLILILQDAMMAEEDVDGRQSARITVSGVQLEWVFYNILLW